MDQSIISFTPCATTTTKSYPDIFGLVSVSSPSSSPIAVCDGAMQSSQGTFGWALVIRTPRRALVQCSGPASGSSCMNSYLAEAYGLLSTAHHYIHL
jgi:hypothetical protein